LIAGPLLYNNIVDLFMLKFIISKLLLVTKTTCLHT